jgi:hypothetical protein
MLAAKGRESIWYKRESIKGKQGEGLIPILFKHFLLKK